MGVDRDVADAAFIALILSVGTACRTNKNKDKTLRKCLKKRDEICAKKRPRTQESAPFFFFKIFLELPTPPPPPA